MQGVRSLSFRGPASRLFRPGLFIPAILILLGILLWKYSSFFSQNWGLSATAIIVLSLLAFYWGFESSIISNRELGVIAVLATIAALGRVPFAIIPGVQPTTFIVLVSGFVFGPRAGFMVGATAALVSNFFLGQGPWTPIQMLAWGLAGTSAGLLGSFAPHTGRAGLGMFSFIWGYAFGWLMNLWFWACFVQPLTWTSFLAAYAASFPFDTLHALGNAAFCLIFGPHIIKVLRRFKSKMVFTLERDFEP